MKRLLCVSLILLLLTGCTGLTPGAYVSVEPHREQSEVSDSDHAVTAENFGDLRKAILSFVEQGVTDGVIRVTNYNGDVESDAAQAAYEVSRQEPVGAYAVDYMTHECVRVVSYYEVRTHITFRRTAEELRRVELIPSTIQLEERLQQALEEGEPSLVLWMEAYWEQDVEAMAQRYWEEHPELVPERPSVTVTTYPQNGPDRILEIDLDWTYPPQELKLRKEAVGESLNGAAEYIRYRQTEREKAELLYTYLKARFTYEAGTSATPLFAALCEGTADPAGLAQAWQLIFDRAGVECHTVTGVRDGEPCTWNVISVDGVYRHLDLARCLLEDSGLRLLTDEEMTDYSWEPGLCPPCQ